MSQTRNTIELLTTILQENGATRVKAETFRLAKFDHDDAVSPLWRLLFELVYYCEFGKIDNISVKAYAELSTEELVVYVKREMQYRGFFSKEFASLPSDMSSGSRELLLGLGWLLCKENIISRFIRSCTSPIDDDTAALHKEDGVTGGMTDQSEASVKQDMYGRVQQLLFLNNKLRLSLRTLYTLQRENSLLKHKVHEATYGVVGASGDRNHLSEMEVYMLRHPQLLKNNLALLEQDNERLQNLLSWRQHEDHFWKWMGSVLDAKLQNKAENAAQITAQNAAAAMTTRDQIASALATGGASSLTEARVEGFVQRGVTPLSSQPGDSDGIVSPRDGSGDGNDYPRRQTEVGSGQVVSAEGATHATLHQSRLTLHQAITKYESIVHYLEKAWEEKSSEITDDELDSVLSSIDQELAFQRTNILMRNCQTYIRDSSLDGSTSVASDIPAALDLPSDYTTTATVPSNRSPSNNYRTMSGIEDDYPPISESRRGDPCLYYEQKPQFKPINTRQRLEEHLAASVGPRADDVSTASTRSSLKQEVGHITDIEHEISSLNLLVDQLQSEVDEKQNFFKQELQVLSGKFEDSVCIPPMVD